MMPTGPVRPSPAGWYEDPYEAGKLRYFDGTRWLDQTQTAPARTTSPVPDAIVALPDEELTGAPRRPRPQALRLLLAIAGVLPFFGVLVVLTRVPLVGGVVALLFLATSIALTAPRVSGRRVDAFFALIPIYNLYLPCRIAWRLAYLPYRDWAPRADEEASWRQVRCPYRSGEVLYLQQEGIS
jgi:hypothetical protein